MSLKSGDADPKSTWPLKEKITHVSIDSSSSPPSQSPNTSTVLPDSLMEIPKKRRLSKAFRPVSMADPDFAESKQSSAPPSQLEPPAAP